MRVWTSSYKGHDIRVEKDLLSVKLYIDNTLLVRSSGTRARARLFARIRNGKGWGEPVLANLNGFLDPHCELMINGVSVRVEKK